MTSVPSSAPSIPASSVKVAKPVSFLDIGNPTVEGVNWLEGYLLGGLRAFTNCDDEPSTTSPTLRYWTYRHPNCDHVDVYVRLKQTVAQSTANIVCTAGSGTSVTFNVRVAAYLESEFVLRCPWGSTDAGWQEITVVCTDVAVASLTIYDVPRPTLGSGEDRLDYIDPTNRYVRTAEGWAIAASDEAGPLGMIQEILNAWDNYVPQVCSWSVDESNAPTVSAGSWTNLFGAEVVWDHQCRQKKAEGTNPCTFKLRTKCAAGITYDLRISSSVGSDTVTLTGLTNTAYAVQTLPNLNVSAQSTDTLTVEARVTAGSGNISVSSFAGCEVLTGWVHVDKQVSTGASPTSFTDIDCSAYVTEEALCMFEVAPSGAGGGVCCFRPNGDAADYYESSTGGQGSSAVSPGTGETGTVCVMCDSGGIVEWKCATANNRDVQLIGFVPMSTPDTNVSKSGMSTTWADVDFAQGLQRTSLICVKWGKTSGASCYTNLRPNGDGNSYEAYNNYEGNVNNRHATNDLYRQATLEAVSGVIEHIASAASRDAEFYLSGYLAPRAWVHAETEVFDDTSPTSYTDINLASTIPALEQRTFVLLRVTASAGTSRFFFRRNGTSTDADVTGITGTGVCSAQVDSGYAAIFAVETDSSGIIEWSSSAAVAAKVAVIGYVRDGG